MTIILYDLPSSLPSNAFSFNTWKARFALNYKALAYKTEWVELVDIERHAKMLGITHTELKPGTTDPLFTLPAIYDPSTGVYVAESMRIAEYLDKTYPDTPSLFPNNTTALQAGVCDAFRTIIDPIFRFGIPQTAVKLNPRSAEYFRKTREQWLGKTIEEIQPKGEEVAIVWGKVQDAWNKTEEWYARNEGKGPFLLGEEPCFADLFIAGFIIWARTMFGEDDQKWKDIASWNGGRWKGILEALDKYAAIV